MRLQSIFICILIILIFPSLSGQKPSNKPVAGFPVNYGEDSVGIYTLPDLLTLKNGKKVTDSKSWTNQRRPEILQMVEEYQFGKTPAAPKKIAFTVDEKGAPALNGKAVRKQVTVYLTPDSSHKINLLIYLPTQAKAPVPLFLNISFFPNTATVIDSGIKPAYMWSRNGKWVPAPKFKMTAIPDPDLFLSEGIGIASVYYGDIEPDFKNGYGLGIRKYYSKNSNPAPDEWGAIAAWSWGLSRIMDYFEKDNQIDAKRVALYGVSRLGKTVLWTGGRDPRFKVVIASCSGEGGAAISRRNYGENLKHLTDTTRYFYQFAANYHNFAKDVDKLPFDAHALVALMAPRPLLLQTGDTDYWSDPKGEFLSALAAEPVFKLFGQSGPETTEMPEANDTSLLLNTLGYYMHSGGHGSVPGDWKVYLMFLKKYL